MGRLGQVGQYEHLLPWGKYEYLKLPMGLCNSPDIFQEKMNELFAGFDYVGAYIDNLIIMTKGSFEEHLKTIRYDVRKS